MGRYLVEVCLARQRELLRAAERHWMAAGPGGGSGRRIGGCAAVSGGCGTGS
jgi:hypothetical protein